MARARQQLTLAPWIAVAFGVVLGQVGDAAAQEEAPDWESGGFVEPTAETEEGETTTTGSSQVPTPYATRSITLPGRTLRVDAGPPDRALLDSGMILGPFNGYGIRIGEAPVGGDVFSMMGLGAAYGVLDELEVGGLVLPIVMSPDGDFGEMTFYARYRFLQTDAIQMGAQLALQLPTQQYFGLGIGVPISIYALDKLRIDTGVEFELMTNTDPGENVLTHFDVPVVVTFNVLPEVFLGGRFGFTAFDPPGADNFEPLIPVGFFGGYTIARKVTADITGAFTFFIWDLEPDWQLVFGANIHFDV